VRCAVRVALRRCASPPTGNGRVESDPCRSKVTKRVAPQPPRTPDGARERRAASGTCPTRISNRGTGGAVRLMVANDSQIGSAQMSRPRPAPEAGERGLSLLSLLGDPNTALAFMFAAGGVQGLLYMGIPHWNVARPLIVLAVSVVACGLAPLVWLSRRRLRSRSRHLLLGIGTAATSLAVFGGGANPASMSTAYFYFWVVLYAAAYLGSVASVVHLAGVGLLYAAALAMDPTPEFPAQWMLAMSALAVTTLIVGTFASRVRQGSDALNFQALHDSLTGLANRALFLNRVECALRADGALSRAEGEAERVAVLFLDIDDFKTVNDSLGHPTGDRLLTAFAGRLGRLTRAVDTLARLGGDEFAVLLESGPMPQTAEDTALRIAEMLETPFELGDTEVSVSVSIGISFARRSQGSCEGLLREADLAMYLAKQNGKGRFETIRPGMQEDALKRLALITDLRQALHDSEFEVFYQPIVGVRDSMPAGAEALVRWHHPRRGLVAPAEFVSAAESTGLIVAIGDWVLNEACRQAQSWRQARTTNDAFYVSVNLSPRQLAEANVVEYVARALRRSGLPPSALVLEMTETCFMPDFDAGLARLTALKDLGVRLAVDDFGTGYSSLNRLQTLPIDIVKIDKSFIDQIGRSRQDQALVQSVIDVTRALGMISIAEGVEQLDQYNVLGELECDAIQGYLFAKPRPGPDTERTLLRLAAHRAPSDPDEHEPDAAKDPGSSPDGQMTAASPARRDGRP
jgi:diguanylate cyclase (GGDEF)-like protein